MNKRLTQDVLLAIFIIEVYLVVTLFYEMKFSNTNGELFIFLSVIFTGAALTYLFGQLFALYSSLAFVAVYGTYLLYLSLVNINVSTASFVVILAVPVILLTIGSYSSYIKKLKARVSELEINISKFVTVDSITGLENITAFNLDLQRQMSFSKRYNTNLYLMVIEIKYYDELEALYKHDGMSQIVKQVSNMLKEATRLEDSKFRLSNNKFAVIFENLKDGGIEIVKTKIKEKVNKAVVKNISGDQDIIQVEVSIGHIMYNTTIESSSEFYNLAKKELIYDV